MFSYDAKYQDELQLNPGEDVVLLQPVEGGWWEGMCRGRQGWFPSNHVEVLPPATRELIDLATAKQIHGAGARAASGDSLSSLTSPKNNNRQSTTDIKAWKAQKRSTKSPSSSPQLMPKAFDLSALSSMELTEVPMRRGSSTMTVAMPASVPGEQA